MQFHAVGPAWHKPSSPNMVIRCRRFWDQVDCWKLERDNPNAVWMQSDRYCGARLVRMRCVIRRSLSVILYSIGKATNAADAAVLELRGRLSRRRPRKTHVQHKRNHVWKHGGGPIRLSPLLSLPTPQPHLPHTHPPHTNPRSLPNPPKLRTPNLSIPFLPVPTPSNLVYFSLKSWLLVAKFF